MAGEYDIGDLGSVLGTGLYDSLFSTQGFSGYNDGFRGDNPWMNEGGFNEGGNTNWLTTPNQNALDSLNGFSFDWSPTGGEGGVLQGYNPSGQSIGRWEQKDTDPFTKMMDMVAPAIASWNFGGALSGMFGGGTLGGALGHGLAQGSMSSMQGGSFGKGALNGAIAGGMQGLGQSGTSIAKSAGITNPTLAGIVNRGAGSTLGSLAAGKSGSEALQSGLTGAAMSGINSLGKAGMDFIGDAYKSLLTDEGSQGDYSTGNMSYGSNYNAPGQSALRSVGIYPEMSNIPPSSGNFLDLNSIGLPSLSENPEANASYGGRGYRPMGADILEQAGLRDGMSYAAPGTVGGFSPDLSNAFYTEPQPQQQTVSLPSTLSGGFSRAADSTGNFGLNSIANYAMNNAGDLASMLYGFYNNRRQQRNLGNQMGSLQSMITQANSQQNPGAKLFGNDSPYAQQLRNTLNARAAATGRRSNVSGRETQLQAMLAEKNAQIQSEYDRNRTSLVSNLAPQMFQLQQARGNLQNNNMNMLLQGLNKTGALGAMGRGLQSLFTPQPSLTGAGSYNAYRNMDDMYGSVG